MMVPKSFKPYLNMDIYKNWKAKGHIRYMNVRKAKIFYMDCLYLKNRRDVR